MSVSSRAKQTLAIGFIVGCAAAAWIFVNPSSLTQKFSGFETAPEIERDTSTLDSTALHFVQPPTLLPNPHPAAPLAVVVRFQSSMPVRARYLISDGDETWVYERGELLTAHEQPLLYFKAGKNHTIRVEIEDSEGGTFEHSEALTFSAPSIPGEVNFPTLSTFQGDRDSGVDGLTLLAMRPYRVRSQTDDPASGGYIDHLEGHELHRHGLLVAVNAGGEIVWFYRPVRQIDLVELMPNQRLLLSGPQGQEEIDWLGFTHRYWQGDRQRDQTGYLKARGLDATAVPIDALRSASVFLENGNRLVVTREMQVKHDFPIAVDNPNAPWLAQRLSYIGVNEVGDGAGPNSVPTVSAQVVGDVIVELTPAGEVVAQWSLFDLLDYRRTTYHSWLSLDFDLYPPDTILGLPKSWSNVVGLAYDAQSRTILVSVRNQDALVAIDYDFGQLAWILGDPAGWDSALSKKVLKPAGGARSAYFPGALNLVQSNEIVVMDAGSYQAVPPTPAQRLADSRPRVVHYKINPSQMTYSEVGHYTLPAKTGIGDNVRLASYFLMGVTPFANASRWLVTEGLGGGVQSVLEVAGQTGTVTRRMTLEPNDGAAEQQGLWLVYQSVHVSNLKQDEVVEGDLLELAEVERVVRSMTAGRGESAVEAPVASIEDVEMPLPDFDRETVSVAGNWDFVMGSQTNKVAHALSLEQTDNVVTGDMNGAPLVAFVRGNSVSFNIRRENVYGNLRQRFRGVLTENGTMNGVVYSEQNGKLFDRSSWNATRSVKP